MICRMVAIALAGATCALSPAPCLGADQQPRATAQQQAPASKLDAAQCVSEIRSSMKSPSSFKLLHTEFGKVWTKADADFIAQSMVGDYIRKNVGTTDSLTFSNAREVVEGKPNLQGGLGAVRRFSDVAEARSYLDNTIAKYSPVAGVLPRDKIDKYYIVTLCYDAANSYGAMLRGQASCAMLQQIGQQARIVHTFFAPPEYMFTCKKY